MILLPKGVIAKNYEKRNQVIIYWNYPLSQYEMILSAGGEEVIIHHKYESALALVVYLNLQMVLEGRHKIRCWFLFIWTCFSQLRSVYTLMRYY